MTTTINTPPLLPATSINNHVTMTVVAAVMVWLPPPSTQQQQPDMTRLGAQVLVSIFFLILLYFTKSYNYQIGCVFDASTTGTYRE